MNASSNHHSITPPLPMMINTILYILYTQTIRLARKLRCDGAVVMVDCDDCSVVSFIRNYMFHSLTK